MAIIVRNTISPTWGDQFNQLILHDPMWKKMHPDRISPPANIITQEDRYEIELSVPGMNKEDIEIHIDRDVLHISGDHQEEAASAGRKYAHQEFAHTSFHRSFALPSHLEDNRIEARYDQGVLRVVLYEKEDTHHQGKKQIDVQ
ncbi:Hsp20/alpha crystallin family protein [Tunicatimonas pelagia]|uniref:Hsp20/alpha crystallin family protein n=1 Tax=Tunicatimonas pelagia TaxID=931531 RepID=UPI0026670FD4|nr:Hsp20/alpha crystallin family protein [Tunicatimonas pelagia]WKN42770.1 Hsp20/alpha crystallin family protein [Tunicatimonas pelagia]